MAAMFQDDSGNTSSMRIMWIVIWLVILFTWSYVSIHNNALANLSPGDAMGVAFLMAGKVGQKHIEKNGKNGTPPMVP